MLQPSKRSRKLPRYKGLKTKQKRKFLNLDNVPPADNEVASMMNVKVRHEESSTQAPSLLTVPVTVIPKTSTVAATTIPLTIQPCTLIPQQSTPTPAPTTEPTTTSIPALLDFSSLFGFDQIVFALEKELSQFKQKKAQAKKDRYIDLIEKSIKDIIKDEVKSQLPQILPQEIFDFATPVIQSTINESLENVILAKSSSQLISTYKALDKDLFESYGKAYYLKRDSEDKDKDEDPPVGSDQGLKRRKTSKDAEPSKGSKSKESKSSSSKGTKPLTPDPDWNVNKYIDFRPPQTWISKIAKAKKPPLTFDELMSTPIDFSAYVMHNHKIDNLTQQHLNNPEAQEYLFDLSKPLPLIQDRGRQVVPIDYFINNDLEHLKGGSSSRKYMTSTTKTKAAKFKFNEKISNYTSSRKETFQDFTVGIKRLHDDSWSYYCSVSAAGYKDTTVE
ncbi:hypothetical protein Tco_1448976 [Tanacetum coccineum]